MKIGIVGAGNVGASVASLLISRNMCKKVTLIDINSNLARAKAMDLAQMAIALGLDISVEGSDKYSVLGGFDTIIITAGLARKNGMDRAQLAAANADIVATAAKNTAKFAPNATIIVVTNPLDMMVWVAFKASGFRKNRIIGMAGELDSARFKYALSQKLAIEPSKCDAIVVGMHNDSMICLSKMVLDESELKEAKLSAIKGGAKIVELMNTSAFYAPAAGVVRICEALQGSQKILSCSVLDDDLVAFSRPVKIDSSGVCELLELKLCQDESEALSKSVDEFIKNIKKLNI